MLPIYLGKAGTMSKSVSLLSKQTHSQPAEQSPE